MSPQDRNPAELRPASQAQMLTLMSLTGCELRPTQTNGEHLRGYCPFHQGGTRRTLAVDATEARFACRACGIKGGPGAFAGMIWGVAAAEAHEMLAQMNGAAPTTERPAPISLRDREMALDAKFRRQNTHLLTLATQFYSREVSEANRGGEYLTALGISRRRARDWGFGFATGRGLLGWLNRQQCTQQELEESPLIRRRPNGGLGEQFHSVITLPDRDAIGATKWMLMVPAAPNAALSETRPRPLSLPGQRPFVLGLAEVDRNTAEIVVTDDPRVYMVMKADGKGCIHTLGRTEANKIADKIASKRPRRVVIAIRATAVAEEIGRTVRGMSQIDSCEILDAEAMTAVIQPMKGGRERQDPQGRAGVRDQLERIG